MYSLMEECQLNQRAIDALPDIVAALEYAAEQLETIYVNAPTPETFNAMQEARAALKKGGF
jgi:hypothetical protein